MASKLATRSIENLSQADQVVFDTLALNLVDEMV